MKRGQFIVLVLLGVLILIALCVNAALMMSDSKTKTPQQNKTTFHCADTKVPFAKHTPSSENTDDPIVLPPRPLNIGSALNASGDLTGDIDHSKRVIQHRPPSHFANTRDELNWYKNELSRTKDLKTRLDAMYSTMKESSSPPAPEVTDQLNLQRVEAHQWVRQLEMKIHQLGMQSQSDDSN